MVKFRPRQGIFRPAILVCICLCAFLPAIAQQAALKGTTQQSVVTPWVAGSPAFAELLVRRTELQSELESLIVDYTEEHPKIKEDRFILGLVQTEIDRLSAVSAQGSSKLTLALGKLVLRKIELETDLWNLMRTYKDEHPDVKRAKRKVEVYEAAIKQILG